MMGSMRDLARNYVDRKVGSLTLLTPWIMDSSPVFISWSPIHVPTLGQHQLCP